ncbi:MAG: YggS family pyridoxal phosphate-dependent enzyme [Actinobacteria bacterium]|nr:YggS family pyridoxal phosphate-dependent enzyme [Actinomycetota bacterium]
MAEVMAPALALEERVEVLRARIESAGRPADEVAVVAVTKGFGAEAVEAAVDAGLHDCGENYAQELLAKAAVVASDAVRWHFLGPVQRNKVPGLAARVALWQGVDRAAAAAEIARRAPGAAVLVQVNLSGDPARPGCDWEAAPALVEAVAQLGLDVRGLMGVAGTGHVRQQFNRLARLGNQLGLAELSMGMSDDLEVAVQEGSTMVRIGTALFGARPGPVQVRR